MIAPGDVIAERYNVEELIGEGGLAQVWRVRHRDLGSVHALKLLLFRKPRLMERLILEGRIQAQLRHPNIVAVTDVVRHGGQVGLVMEYVDGVPMQSWLEVNQPLAVERALELFAPILAGVRAAHDAGVLHRDLKPANILLAKVGRALIPKVTDFGIAKVVEGSFEGLDTRSGAVMGTPGYLAPEQAVDASTVDRRADLFALGAILYEMLAGRRAFEGCDTSIPKDFQPVDLQSIRPEIPDLVARAVERAIAWDPADRFPEVAAFAAALFVGRPRLQEVVEGNTGSSEHTPVVRFGSTEPVQSARELIRQATGQMAAPPNPTVIPSPSAVADTVSGELFGARDDHTTGERSLTTGERARITGERPGEQAMPWARKREDDSSSPWTRPVVGETPAWTSPPPLTPGGPIAPIRHTPPRRQLRPAAVALLAGGLFFFTSASWVLLRRGGDEVALPVGPPPAPASANLPTNPGVTAGWRGATTDAVPEAEDAPVKRKVVTPRAPSTPTPAAPPPVEAPPPPAAATPAAVPAPPPPPLLPPDLRGTWAGQANGRPFELRLVSQDGTTVRGEVSMYDGPAAVNHRVTGTVRPDGALNLRASDSGLVFTGKVTGKSAAGRYLPEGAGSQLDWSVRQR